MNGRTNLDMVLAVCVFLAALAGLAAADTHYVSPGESIQAAIDDPCTVNGDEIVVAQGTYVGGINFNGKAITLYSSGGPEVTTIDGRLAESFREDFNDGDYTGWQIVDQGNYSTPSSWSAATGEMVQSSNIYTEPTSDWRLLGTYALCTQDMPWGDYEVSLSIKSVDDDWMGVMFRYVDSDNYYRFAWNGSNGNRRLVKMVNGAVTTLQQDASTYVGDQWYRARIAVRGENLRVFVDDVKVFDVNDASFSNGAIALYCWANAGTYFDNIEVKYPAYHVVQCVSGEDGNTILEGFTITGGNANGPWPDDAGGGMFNASSSPTVINCKFINNSGTYCGGMFNDTSSPIVTNCNFISNSALIGGGMSNAYSSSPTVTNCTFSDNHVSYDGGGMFNDTVSPTVTNCTFGGNFADQYGGGMYNRNCSPTLTNCTFSGNTAYDGGGMYNNDGSSPTLSTCTFSNNTASHNAGGMNNTNSSNPTMTDCNFTENEAGGGGGMINSVNCSPTIINCVYMGNSANYGGGIYNNDNSNPIVTNCTFTNNEANTGGGAIHNGGSSPTVTNCILWGDTPNEIYDDGTSSTTVNYSDVLWSGAGGNNIYGDPVFLDAASGDLRLGSCSPCVDAGDNNAVPAGVTTDLDGNPRFVDDANVPDTGIGTPPIVDMGAYERQISSFAPICNVTKGVWYCKIQVAIDDPCTVNGDEIVVAPGTYYEAINFNGKAVRLYSSGGPNDTAIDAAGLNSSVVTCNSGEDANTILEGFTITGGMGTTVSGDKCGGGMYNYSNSSPMVTNCNFNNNTAIYGGGMCNNLNSSPTLTNCTFSSNTANYYGGGMWNSSNSNPNVTNCIFNGNEAEISGGGMFNNGTSPTVKNCTFRGNSVGYRGGGMYNNVGNPTVNNCSFAENSAANAGGGMYNNGANPTVTNCTFTQNVGNISGGGIYTAGGSPTVTNCILWGDTAPTGPEIFGGSPIVKYSDVDGGWPGAGNINISPFFVDAGAGDLRLRWYSPCVDSGDNNAPLLPATDLAGNPRVMDGDGDGNSIVDMGAYELEAGMVKVGIGTLEVTIEPNEAIDAGAKWKVEGGEQWYNSGEVVSVAPGYHRVEVNELPGWYEPETLLVGYDSLDPNNVWPQNLWVRVIGDMNATATSEYSPVPVFAIGEIPPRDAPHGRTLEFYVDANWLGDDVSFSLTTTFDPNYPEPEGPILIDPCSGLFTYEPNDANDRTAFAVTFRAESGVDVNEQSVEITPIADLALEYEIVSRPVHDLPDPCDHIFVNEILSDVNEVLNGIEHQVRSVTIGGKLVFIEDVPGNPVYVYNGATDVNDLTIYAETVVIGDPLRLPQTNVTIYAAELCFEGAADINTTPIDLREPPGTETDGLTAGNISLYIESYGAAGELNGRLIMGGTKGYHGGSAGDGGVLTCTLDTQQPLAWLSPYALKMVIAHARDAYLYRYTAETHDILSEYEGLLSAYMALAEWNDLPERWQFEFEQMDQEIVMLLHRLDNGLDYFGNPPDWVPALSFEVLYTVYEQEIDHAIRVLYLSYWLQNEANDISKKELALSNCRSQLWDDTVQAKEDYSICKELIGPLKARASSIADRIGTADGECYGLLCDLKNKEAELLERAKENVHEAHKVPWWKTAGRVLSTIGTSTIAGAGVGTVAGPEGTVVGAIAGAAIGTISVLTDDSIMNPDPWPQASMRTDVAKQFNSIDFEQATEGWIDDFDDIESLSDIEANGADFYLQTLEASAADMADGLWGVKEALKTTVLDNEEVETALSKIKASDPTFSRLVDQVTELMVEKQLFNRQVAAAMQKVATLSNSMTNNVLAIDALNRDASHLNQIVDPRVNMYLKDMERRAMARLRKYHYYMAKAYEYRLLEPYPGDLNIDDMFSMMVSLASADGTLSLDDFSALKAVYEEQLSTLAEHILDEFFLGGHVEQNVSTEYGLSEEEIIQLDAGEPVTVNLFEEGLFPSTRENIRIVDMNVAGDINVVVTGDCGSYGYVVLTMYHPSISKLQWKDDIYLFRHLEQGTQEPLDIEWTSEYHPVSGSLYHAGVSASSQSLLWTLLSESDRAHAMIYSRPGAWADIVITKEEYKDQDCQMDIENLTFVVEYDYFDKEDDLQTLRVATEPNIPPGLSRYELLPYFLVDTADESGREDGIGDFYRIYHWDNTPDVYVTAAKTYGNWRFEKWVDKFGHTLGYDLTLHVSFPADHTPPITRRDQTVYAQYEYDGPIWAGDINADLKVDLRDFSALAAAWLTELGDPAWDEYCDISSPVDYVIDEFDLKVLCADWLASP